MNTFMPSSTNNNGGQPLTQVSRDTMAQNDHDKLVEYGVLLQNIMAGQIRLETQIKDLIQGQATALAAWEASSKAVHDAQDSRLRKLEDLATQYVPMVNELTARTKNLEDAAEGLKNTRSAFVGGWRTALFIGAIISGIAGLIISIINIFK